VNSLSWLIYLAELIGRVHFLGWLVLIFSVGGLVGPPFIALMNHVPGYDDVDWSKFKTGKWYAMIAASMMMLVLLPSRDVVYAIAASEIGEEVIKNEEVKGVASEATAALRAWMRSQTK